MTDSLRARIERAYDEGSRAAIRVKKRDPLCDIPAVMYVCHIDAIVAALGGADSDEVAEILTPGIESGDIDQAVADVCSYFYLIRRGNNDDD